MRRIRTIGAWLLAVVFAIIAGACMGSMASSVLHAQAQQLRDLLFVRRVGCGGELLDCTSRVHFNGHWNGVELCRALQCVRFDDIFKENR